MNRTESKIIDLLEGRNSGKVSNTEVVVSSDRKSAIVWLHGSKIAEIEFGAEGAGEERLAIYDGGYRSNATKSRLNALLGYYVGMRWLVFQREGVWYLRNPYDVVFFTNGTQFQFGKIA